jgi:hypothetical protein
VAVVLRGRRRLTVRNEDQSFVVAPLGVYLLTRRDWRQGVACLALGLLWYVLVLKLLIPGESPTGHYGYWSYVRLGGNPLSLLLHIVIHPVATVRIVFGNHARAHTIARLYLPLLCLPLLSRTIVTQLPLLAERFLSSSMGYWGPHNQYTLAIAATLFIGTADGIGTLRTLPLRADRRRGPRARAVTRGFGRLCPRCAWSFSASS